MGRTAVGIIEPHIRDLAKHLRTLEALGPQTQEPPPMSYERIQSIRLQAPTGAGIVETVTLRPRESLVLAAGRRIFAVVGDTDGDEHFRMRIYLAAANGVELVHDEAPRLTSREAQPTLQMMRTCLLTPGCSTSSEHRTSGMNP